MTRAIRTTLLALTALLIGCTSTPRELMPTPLNYRQPGGQPLFTLPTEQRSAATSVDLLYITDRGPPDAETPPGMPYGQGRARNLAFGTARVRIAPNLGWERLLHESAQARRSAPLPLELGNVVEVGRFPTEPYDVTMAADGLYRSDEVVAAHRLATQQFQQELNFRVAQSPRREVVLYIHGFNESFESAAFTAAELCHYLGREPVCGFFTWPASTTGNFLISYTNTTESAQYAVGHLKKAIRLIAATPGVERIQLLAHSRGTALTLAAIRELALESIAAGHEPIDTLKLDNVVMFSPDIDVDVAGQELTAYISDPDLISVWPGGRIPRTMQGKLTVYSSPEDRALLVSKILFRSRVRVGELRPEDIPRRNQEYLAKLGRIDIVVYEGKRTDIFGHSYFTTNPQVSADVMQLLRYGHRPEDPERGLVRAGPVVWTFPKGRTLKDD